MNESNLVPGVRLRQPRKKRDIEDYTSLKYKDVARALRSHARSIGRTKLRIGDEPAMRRRQFLIRALNRAANDVVKLGQLKDGTYSTVKMRGFDVPLTKKDLDLSRG